jgi:chromosome partitioning protein
MGQIIAIANTKGGVGKTTTAINLGAGLQKLGKRVLLVDLDPQSALTASLGINPADLALSVYNVMIDDEGVSATSIIQSTDSGLDVLPATIDLSAAELELVSELGRESILRDALEAVKGNYDYILIDCNPSLGLLTVNALTAADGVIIPLQCEFLAMRGLQLLLRSIERVRIKLNPKLRITGILPTMFDSRTTHSNEVLDEARNAFGNKVFDVVIKNSVRFKEAPVSGLSLLDYAPGHEGARTYLRLAEVIINGR